MKDSSVCISLAYCVMCLFSISLKKINKKFPYSDIVMLRFKWLMTVMFNTENKKEKYVVGKNIKVTSYFI